jgi:hypothetical protein
MGMVMFVRGRPAIPPVMSLARFSVRAEPSRHALPR